MNEQTYRVKGAPTAVTAASMHCLVSMDSQVLIRASGVGRSQQQPPPIQVWFKHAID